MTKYNYVIETKEDGAHITVTRLSDNATKTFYQAGVQDTRNLHKFMDSITDELAESYFPKPRKK